MAKFIERQFSQTTSFSTMMIGEMEVRECALVCVVPCSQNEIFHLFTLSAKAEITSVHPPFLRRNLYPAGGAGYRPGRHSDAEVEPLCERSQQTVHHCCRAQLVCCHTSAAHRLFHPEGWRSLSTQVATNFTLDCIKFPDTTLPAQFQPLKRSAKQGGSWLQFLQALLWPSAGMKPTTYQ